MTTKQKAFTRNLAKESTKTNGTPNATVAYAQTYDATNASAGTAASRLLQMPNVQDAYRAAILKYNPPEIIGKKLKSLTNAKRGIYFEGQKVAKEPDSSTQLQALKLTVQTMSPDMNSAGNDNRSINFIANINPQDLAFIATTLTKLNQSFDVEH